MLGVYHILHFFVLFLIVITVFRDWHDWQIAFAALVLAAVGVSFGSIRPDQRFTVILAIAFTPPFFMIFAFFFTLFLFVHKDGSDNKKGIPVLIGFIFWPFRFYIFNCQSNKAGDVVGCRLLGNRGFYFSAWYYQQARAYRIDQLDRGHCRGRRRRTSLFFFNSNSIIAHNQFLSKFNTNRATFQTRLLSWEAASKTFTTTGSGYRLRHYADNF